MLQTRQQEKELYPSKRRSNMRQKVDEDGYGRSSSQSRETKDKFDQAINKDQMDTVAVEVSNYVKAFQSYTDLSHRRDQTMEQMRAHARKANAQAEAIQAEQKRRLTNAKLVSADRIQDSLAITYDLNQIVKWFIDARKNEKEYIISNGDQQWKNTVDERLVSMTALLEDLKTRFTKAADIEAVSGLMKEISDYKQKFDHFGELMAMQNKADDEMVAAARAANDVCADARLDQKNKMTAQIVSANRWLLTGFIVAVAIGSLLAFFHHQGDYPPVARSRKYRGPFCHGGSFHGNRNRQQRRNGPVAGGHEKNGRQPQGYCGGR